MAKRGENKETIKVGSVTLPLWLHKKGWRAAYRNETGEWKYITRKDKREVKEEAKKQAAKINNQTAETSLNHDEAALWQRVKKLGITHTDLDAWEAQNGREQHTLRQVYDAFMADKKANRGNSGKNIKNLTDYLSSLVEMHGESAIETLSPQDLEAWLNARTLAPRSRKNWRASAVTLFRWAREREYLPDKKTAAEKLTVPRVTRKIPETYTPEEMKLMLAACPADYMPWLVLAGFTGARLEELIVDRDSTKNPLDWSDFRWDRDIIVMRPETAKTGHRRIIPILPVVRAWLYDKRQESGPACPQYAPHRSWKRTETTLTTRLGKLVGGWRRNALRHSFISYRAAQVGLAQAAMEAGNSESEARKSYNDAKGKDEAEIWFSLTPSELIGTKNKNR